MYDDCTGALRTGKNEQIWRAYREPLCLCIYLIVYY